MPVCTGVSHTIPGIESPAGAMLGSRNGVQLRFQKFLRSPALCKIREINPLQQIGPWRYAVLVHRRHSFVHSHFPLLWTQVALRSFTMASG
jgi:hypothetical protein